MKIFLSEEALVAAYWRKLARSIDKPRVTKQRKLSQFTGRPGMRQRITSSQHPKAT